VIKNRENGKNRVFGEMSHQQTSALAIDYNACQFIGNLPGYVI